MPRRSPRAPSAPARPRPPRAFFAALALLAAPALAAGIAAPATAETPVAETPAAETPAAGTLLAQTLLAQTGLPVPRFVSLRSNEVNVRTGPGLRYPVQWVFRRKSLPVEILAEWDTWRKVRDWEGATGWVHQSTLSGQRTALILGPAGQLRALRAEPEPSAAAVAEAEPMVVGELVECQPGWCRLAVQGHQGWLQRRDLWGAYPNETFQ